MSDKPSKVALFCDEAGKETDRYLAVGGLVVTDQHVTLIRRAFDKMKRRLGIGSEVKWNKTKKGTRDKYQEMADYFFNSAKLGNLEFHCILVDFHRFDHGLRADGGKNESLKRMYYQLIRHRLGKRFGPSCNLYAFPDKANELVGLEKLKAGLNSDLRKHHQCSGAPLKAIEFRDSEKEDLLQLNDLILGAVCYQKNRRFDQDDAGQPKANLSGYILGRSGLPHYDTDTPLARKDFTIWNLKSKYLKGGA